jgi:predicted nucleotidyltransferase
LTLYLFTLVSSEKHGVILNLLTTDIIFTILSFKRDNELIFSLEYLLQIKGEKMHYNKSRYVLKKIMNTHKNLKGVFSKLIKKNLNIIYLKTKAVKTHSWMLPPSHLHIIIIKFGVFCLSFDVTSLHIFIN